MLGELYELHLPRKGLSQFFIPWPICQFMAASICDFATRKDGEGAQPLRILDPTCGSGRMLLAASRLAGPRHEYYGIDVDATCVKMTALNLFLSGLFNTETMCADALLHEDFRVSYATSFLPFGLFRIQEKERSLLWHLMRNARETKPSQPPADFNEKHYPDGSQLSFF